MDSTPHSNFTAFINQRLIGSGPLSTVIAALVSHRQEPGAENLEFWLFEDTSGKNLELDFRGQPTEIEARVLAQLPPTPAPAAPAAVKAGPGRPKLGVTAREVTLLPQHWEWLASQPGGASVALRKLVHAASKASALQDRARTSLEAAHRFMLTMGGCLPGFEEATRAMFKGDFTHARNCLADWPTDLRSYASRLLENAELDANAAAEPPTQG